MSSTIEVSSNVDDRASAPSFPRLGMDMITFFNGPFWGYEHFRDLTVPGAVSPDVFWDRVLDIIGESGIEGVEIAGGFSHYTTALERYGTPDRFASALGDRGLELCSGFFAGLLLDSDGSRDSDAWERPDRQKDILEEVAAYADFLRAAGSEIMVMATPMRRTWNVADPQFVDGDYLQRFASLVNRMGYVARTRGVRLAIHPEAHAIFWFRRDIRFLLDLTDPVYVGFCPDTAHITLGGGDPIAVFEDNAERVVISHWKDALGPVSPHVEIDDEISPSHHPFFANVGDGRIDWSGWTRALRAADYSGWAILELDAAPDPGKALRDARSFVDTELRPLW
ncbi:sugar phosphate isomerase/epimerase family protein [Leifsonia sp. NPDC058194]|uniref:sugar phosphate isomerase/epimerase family protein n=1 Tax=Leifsonia sp. NPDC058194 TaxID=3346374 RepID=UPI0036D91A97